MKPKLDITAVFLLEQACAGRLKRDDELYFSEQPEAAEFLRKQAERQAKEDAR